MLLYFTFMSFTVHHNPLLDYKWQIDTLKLKCLKNTYTFSNAWCGSLKSIRPPIDWSSMDTQLGGWPGISSWVLIDRGEEHQSEKLATTILFLKSDHNNPEYFIILLTVIHFSPCYYQVKVYKGQSRSSRMGKEHK